MRFMKNAILLLVLSFAVLSFTGCGNNNDNPFDSSSSSDVNAVVDLIKMQNGADDKADIAIQQLDKVKTIHDVYKIASVIVMDSYQKLYLKQALNLDIIKENITTDDFNHRMRDIMKLLNSASDKAEIALINNDFVTSIKEVYGIASVIVMDSYQKQYLLETLKLDKLRKNITTEDFNSNLRDIMKLLESASDKTDIALINYDFVSSIKEIYSNASVIVMDSYQKLYLTKTLAMENFTTDVSTLKDILRLLNNSDDKADIAIVHLRAINSLSDASQVSSVIVMDSYQKLYLDAANEYLKTLN